MKLGDITPLHITRIGSKINIRDADARTEATLSVPDAILLASQLGGSRADAFFVNEVEIPREMFSRVSFALGFEVGAWTKS
jgi:hypothetical protein